ncbi:MAG: hypothetical protein ACPLKS_07915 [Caldisericum exile]|uniref:hypothetical protein n=1 Tax=Caldisericum exile TaxID=693075 RepID=UPI003C7791D4
MKEIKYFWFFLLLTFIFNIQYLSAECDNGTPENTFVFYFRNCPIEVTYCCDLNNGFYHNFSIKSIKIFSPCDSSIYEENKREITDSIIKQIAIDGQIKCWEPIPDCKFAELCIVRWKSEICYQGWQYVPEPNPYWKMDTCSQITYCNETIRICWDSETREYRITRQGYVYPECTYPCKDDCGF